MTPPVARRRMRWNLSAKITLFAGVFLLLSLLAVGATLWTAWNLQGGAAAVNEAGRLRMLSYQLALSAATGQRARLPGEARQLQGSLDLLRNGDSARPLLVPWDPTIRSRYAWVLRVWSGLRPRWLGAPGTRPPSRSEVDAFVAGINRLVMAIEHRLDFWNTMLHTAQLALAGLVVFGTMLMFVAGYLLVLDPVGRLSRGVVALARGDYAARVEVGTTDELGDLAQAFNRMAGQLQGVHDELEERVRLKTADLSTEQRRLAALYEVSALVSRAQDLPSLAESFVRALQRIAGADAAVLRWTDDTARRYVLLAAEGMPESLSDDERCLLPGACYCGQAEARSGTRVVQLLRDAQAAPPACVGAGFTTLVCVPVATQQRLLGEVDLLYRDASRADPAQQALLEALAGHMAAAMESLRGAALEREAVVARERNLLARELHDSIAQALAYMKIQLQLLRGALHAGDAARSAKALDDLEHGVRDSLVDVRELLLHFRTRTRDEDIEPALRVTLHKFELQSGIAAQLRIDAHGQPLPPDVQIQVLHIVQEALSNVRKHAQARRVELDVRSVPRWSFELRDDGVGFDAEAPDADSAAHVGQHIMRERASTIGAALHIASRPGHGTRVLLELAAAPPRSLPPDENDHAR